MQEESRIKDGLLKSTPDLTQDLWSVNADILPFDPQPKLAVCRPEAPVPGAH